MFITLATDMVLKRQFFQQQLIQKLAQIITATLIMQPYDERERIVNRDGKVVSRWNS